MRRKSIFMVCWVVWLSNDLVIFLYTGGWPSLESTVRMLTGGGIMLFMHWLFNNPN